MDVNIWELSANKLEYRVRFFLFVFPKSSLRKEGVTLYLSSYKVSYITGFALIYFLF